MEFKGHVDEISRSKVVGWAVDLENPQAKVTVSVRTNGREYARCVADRRRPGLGRTIGDNFDDDHAFEIEFSPRLLTFKDYSIEVETADGSLLPSHTHLLPAPPRAEGKLLPLLVTSRGRSGTTLLMSRLRSLPDFVLADVYPFEVRLLNYYTSVVKVLCDCHYPTQDEPDFVELISSNRLAPPNPWNNPGMYNLHGDPGRLSRIFNELLPGELNGSFRRAIHRFYEELCRTQDKSDARYFIEKCDLDEDIRLGARALMGGVKELVLIRDPRDFLCSGKKFWTLTPDELLRTAQISCSRIERIADEAAEDTLIVRYEDLIREQQATLTRLGDFLGVDLNRLAAGQDGDLFRIHATSGSPEQSIGRWRGELSEKEIAFCSTELRSFIERFGYELDPVPAARDNRDEALTQSASSAGDGAAGRADVSLSELMMRFESLGENCEFGLVQRRCDAEPLGLFRFASAPLPKLLAAMEARFEGLGQPVELAVELSANGREYMVADRRFGFLYHAWVLAGEMTPEAIHAREVRRLPLLIRKLAEDLTAGEKIFICHGMEEALDQDQVRRLLAVIRSYGPAPLLWVQTYDGQHEPGSVEVVEPGLFKAYIDRFAPRENAHDLSLACWIAICREAYRLWQERRSPAAPAKVEEGRRERASPPATAATPQLAPELPAKASTVPPPAEHATEPEPELKPNELMMRFESLGENCEFGLVQRRCGAEPLGLFRFASAPLVSVRAALEARFEGLGALDKLDVELSSNGREYMVADRRFGFLYHAWVLADEMRPEEIREREARRLPLLVRKLVEDLTAGRKLLVLRGMVEPLERGEVEQVLGILRRYGPNTVFWVELADPKHPAGTVERLGENLLKGYIDRFAPGEDAHDLSLDCWVAICREAERLWRRRGRATAMPPAAAAAE